MHIQEYKYIKVTASFSGVSFAEAIPCHSSNVDFICSSLSDCPKKINFYTQDVYVFSSLRDLADTQTSSI